MQEPRPDSDDESDTAFGGLAPRSGPGGETRGRRRAGAWLVAAAVIVVIVLVALLVGARA
jgi:hypothetical protein